MRVGFERAAPAPPPLDDPGVPELVERIRTEIEADGPMTFARFMERALYEPGLGYYATGGSRPTRQGDFLTAPELHPIFGWTLARQLDEMWQRLGSPAAFVVREYGAGSGTLRQSITDGLGRLGSGLAARLSYEPVEIGGGPHGRMVGCILGNEFIDALPVHRVVMHDGRLRELFVGCSDGRFVEVVGEPSDPRLADRFTRAGIQLSDGQRGEVNLAMADWLATVARDLETGYVLLFDYAAPAEALFGPSRASGTLRAFRGQYVSSDVLAGVGNQDITSTVDLDALADAATAVGLDVLGRTTQAEFLMGAGLEAAFATARDEAADDWDGSTLLRSSVRRLLDPAALGGYWAVLLGSNVSADPPLSGLSFQIRR